MEQLVVQGEWGEKWAGKNEEVDLEPIMSGNERQQNRKLVREVFFHRVRILRVM